MTGSTDAHGAQSAQGTQSGQSAETGPGTQSGQSAHSAPGDLGASLRAWRDRLSPHDVGYPAGDARRAAGLRREELAALAGLSVDYIVRLEQGRARHPSAQVAASLARALQLSDTERDHLFVVAGLLPPSSGEVPAHIPPGVQRLVTRLGEIPVAVFTASWDLLSWSPLWAALLGEPRRPASGRPNLIRALFTGTRLGEGSGEQIVRRSGSVDAFGASLVADLRRVHGRYPDDRGVNALVAELVQSSADFRELWNSGAVGEHQSERKVVHNDVVGELELDCDVFTAAGSELRIVAYTAPAGSDAAAKLDFLRVSALAAVRAGS
ncbi:helix-turn-helix transcriptional regulator [Herbiconiux sp. YIM B11900]|uniref:helix-turn-helix transcriptional regulator n=1 Tax=Herbiconiux sp. YIM B11900 TaxID=3404131 RepID=UPI003F853BBE